MLRFKIAYFRFLMIVGNVTFEQEFLAGNLRANAGELAQKSWF